MSNISGSGSSTLINSVSSSDHDASNHSNLSSTNHEERIIRRMLRMDFAQSKNVTPSHGFIASYPENNPWSDPKTSTAPEIKVRQYGNGWLSSSTPIIPYHGDFDDLSFSPTIPPTQAYGALPRRLPTTSINILRSNEYPPIGRARSPSLPVILPSDKTRQYGSPCHRQQQHWLSHSHNDAVVTQALHELIPSKTSAHELHPSIHRPGFGGQPRTVRLDQQLPPILSSINTNILMHRPAPFSIRRTPSMASPFAQQSLSNRAPCLASHRQSSIPSVATIRRECGYGSQADTDHEVPLLWDLLKRGDSRASEVPLSRHITPQNVNSQNGHTDNVPFTMAGRQQRPLHIRAESASVPRQVDLGNRAAQVSHVESMPELPVFGPSKNIYILTVPHQVTEGDLKRLASPHGYPVSARVIQRDLGPRSGTSNQTSCYAFVLFPTHQEARSFLNALIDHGVECEYGKMTYTEEYRALEDLDSCNVYIENLPMCMTDTDLDDLLANWGKCMSPKFMRDTNGKRKGPVLARMETREQAESVVEALNGKRLSSDSFEVLKARIADSAAQKAFKGKYQKSVVGASCEDLHHLVEMQWNQLAQQGPTTSSTVLSGDEWLRHTQSYQRSSMGPFSVKNAIPLAANSTAAYERRQHEALVALCAKDQGFNGTFR